MSWGLYGPSEIISPFETLSPSNTVNVLCFGINISTVSAFLDAPSGVITNLTFPLVSFPNDTSPVSSANIAASFGVLASNRSATLGRPPVISLVFDATTGILAITSPAVIFWPSCKLIKADDGNGYVAGALKSPTKTTLPLPSTIETDGLRSLPADGLSATSIISILLKPVKSSVWDLTVTPSSISVNLILPDVSVIIGLVYGSHEAILISASSSLPLLTSRVAPYGTLYCSVILPLASSIIHSAFLEITTCNLSLFITVLISSENFTVPEFLL